MRLRRVSLDGSIKEQMARDGPPNRLRGYLLYGPVSVGVTVADSGVWRLSITANSFATTWLIIANTGPNGKGKPVLMCLLFDMLFLVENGRFYYVLVS